MLHSFLSSPFPPFPKILIIIQCNLEITVLQPISIAYVSMDGLTFLGLKFSHP